MKSVYYDLLERYNDIEDETSAINADVRILSETDDSEIYAALNPDRADCIECFPWHKSQKVLCLGANYGAYIGLAGRVGALDIVDPADERLELVRRRLMLCRVTAHTTDTEYKADLSRNEEIAYKLQTSKTEPGSNLRTNNSIDSTAAISAAVSQGITGNISNNDVRLMREPEDHDYDVVIADITGADDEWELKGDKLAYLRSAASRLKSDGALILIADNADALRFKAGILPKRPELLIDREFAESVKSVCGFEEVRRYYPLPDAAFAKNIYSERFMPGAGSFKDISDAGFEERSAVYNDESLYESLCDKGCFREYAPSYIYIYLGHGCDTAFADYIRFNRGRAAQYALKTELYLSCRERFVRKSALTALGNAHIESFKHKYELITSELKGRAMAVSPRVSHDEASLAYADFDYIEGKELAKLLALHIADGRAPESEIKDALLCVLGTPGSDCHNLDALFENIIVSADGTYHFIDYEWVSEESLDYDFVAYRILSYWYDANKHRLSAYADKKAFTAVFGIDPDKTEDFDEREAAFQQSVRGDDTWAQLADKFRPERVSPQLIREQKQRMAELTEWNLRLQDEIEEHKTALSKEREVERLSQNHIRNIERMLEDREARLAVLSAENAVLARHQSLLSRLKRKLIGALDAWAPAESNKRRLIHYVKNTLLHPKRMFGLYLTPEGRRYIRGDFRIGGEFSEGGLLTLPVCDEPLVSIVIPAYNQVAYTYACIRSVIANTDSGVTPYEVILADDVSTDATAEIGDYIQNIIISRNSSNMGFLKNCNQAAAKARGEYIFFLNNDTKVHEGWLDALVKLMEQDESIGMAGSKLVYADGRLQEAGGIIWSDASGWNYGRLDDPTKPEYNYVKDVDYISGAAIMIRTSLWQEIGGFDEYFAPAYCEDSDLAFEVRKHGRRVVYQPESVVTHFEGISNGTDVQGSGLKRYQLVNQEKFKTKWASELKAQSVNTGNPDPFKARDRSQHKPCIVIIDHYVPTWDRDAGSKTTYQYIRMFLKKGYNVKFIGDNFLHEEPYTSALEQLGVEVLYGIEYRDSIYEYLRKNSGNIDYCYLNRPHIAIKYIDFLKKNTDIKCIFYGHDLHYLRILREYELTGEIRKKRESDYWRSVEFSVMEQADMVYYPSELEIEAIHKYHPEIPAKAITAYVWEDFKDESWCKEDFDKRRGLLFVGGFKHPPNADAVRWFASDILPRVRELIPDITLYVAGSGADDELIRLGRETAGIEILGFVSDERLAELYKETRLTVVPLRYGAGVKGKVVEAIYNNAAVITTSIGAEGIPEATSVMGVTDSDPESLIGDSEAVGRVFADKLIALYNDTDRCLTYSKACTDYMRAHYSVDAAWSVIAEDFDNIDSQNRQA